MLINRKTASIFPLNLMNVERVTDVLIRIRVTDYLFGPHRGRGSNPAGLR